MEPSRSWKPRVKLWVNIILNVWLHTNTKNTHKYKNNYKHKYEDEISKVSGLGGGHHPPSTSCPTPARSVSTSRSRLASSTRSLSLSSLPPTSSLSLQISKHRKRIKVTSYHFEAFIKSNENFPFNFKAVKLMISE